MHPPSAWAKSVVDHEQVAIVDINGWAGPRFHDGGQHLFDAGDSVGWVPCMGHACSLAAQLRVVQYHDESHLSGILAEGLGLNVFDGLGSPDATKGLSRPPRSAAASGSPATAADEVPIPTSHDRAICF